MLNTVPDPIVPDSLVQLGGNAIAPFGHPHLSSSATYVWRCWWSAPLCALIGLLACKVHAQAPSPPQDTATSATTTAAAAPRCLPDRGGYLRARLKGAIDMELNWGNEEPECTGAVRPTDGGIRMRFTGQNSHAAGEPRLVLVFGIAGLREGVDARALPVNVTVMREGTGEFFGTQGDDKCTLDEVRQTPLVGIPHRARSYRVEARGFCTEPARALQGEGVVLITRFDYAGRVDFDSEDESDPQPQPGPASKKARQ